MSVTLTLSEQEVCLTLLHITSTGNWILNLTLAQLCYILIALSRQKDNTLPHNTMCNHHSLRKQDSKQTLWDQERQAHNFTGQVHCEQSHKSYCLTLKVLNFWTFTSYCCLKPLWSDMGEVVPARTSPTLHPPSPPTVHQLSRLALYELIPSVLFKFPSVAVDRAIKS